MLCFDPSRGDAHPFASSARPRASKPIRPRGSVVRRLAPVRVRALCSRRARRRALLDAFLIPRLRSRKLDTEDAWDLGGLEGLREVHLETNGSPGQLRTSRSFAVLHQPESGQGRAVGSAPDPDQGLQGRAPPPTRTTLFSAHHNPTAATGARGVGAKGVQVTVVGDFSDWSRRRRLLAKVGETGIYTPVASTLYCNRAARISASRRGRLAAT